MRIAMIGTGYGGLVSGTCFSDVGRHVVHGQGCGQGRGAACRLPPTSRPAGTHVPRYRAGAAAAMREPCRPLRRNRASVVEIARRAIEPAGYASNTGRSRDPARILSLLIPVDLRNIHPRDLVETAGFSPTAVRR